MSRLAAIELATRTVAAAGGSDVLTYYNDPVGFTAKYLPAIKLETYQKDVLNGLVTNRRQAARATRGSGKSTTCAVGVLWFAATRQAAGEDWRVVTTASVWRQLTKYLWPEVRKWAPRLDWSALGMEPWKRNDELLDNGIKLATGEAFAVACTDPASIEGLHADQILGIFDESKAIPDEVWDSAEGWFSSGEVYVLAVSTPGQRRGRFYDIFARRPGLDDWACRHITVEEVVAAGRVKPEWVEKRRLMWGEDSPFYRQQVLGEFADIQEDGLIPLEWVEAAVARYEDSTPVRGVDTVTTVGVDVARHGNDESVILTLTGDRVTSIETWSLPDVMAFTGKVTNHLGGGATAVVDADGMGVGVFDRLRELGLKAVAFHGAPHTEWSDRSGELTFFNTRSAAWWCLREQLDPAHHPTLALPPDDDLIADLTAPKWDQLSSGKIRVEPKRETKKRLGRSTDRGDSAVMANWERHRPRDPGPAAEFHSDSGLIDDFGVF